MIHLPTTSEDNLSFEEVEDADWRKNSESGRVTRCYNKKWQSDQMII